MNNKALLERIKLAEQGIYEEPKAIKQPTSFKKLIKPIFAITLGVGAAILSLIFFLQPAIEKAKETPGVGEAELGLLSALPMVFVVVTIVGAVTFMASAGKQQKENEEENNEQILETH